MKRLLNILVFCCLSMTAFAQEETRVVDSLLGVVNKQEGREKVKTMMELAWEFYDISFDDGINWGEKAVEDAILLNQDDLVAEANYTLGVLYAQHSDLDLAKHYLYLAYTQYIVIDDSDYIQEFGWDFSSTKFAFLSLWNIATYELALGSIDSAYEVYEKALPLAKMMNDTSAYASVISNMGLIWYKRSNSEMSLRYNSEAKKLFEAIGDDLGMLRLQSNIAVLYMERERFEEARSIFWDILPRFEAYGDSYYSFLACKNLGAIYENALVNYDSALYYFQKAIDCGGSPLAFKENEISLSNEKSGALVEMGNIMERQGNHPEAIAKYEEALALAESSGYLYGRMEACVGLGKIYSKLGQAQKSLQYFNRYFELEQKSGLVQLRSTFRKSLVLDYARLGMIKELEAELSDVENAISESQRENVGLYDENDALRTQLSDILQSHDSQNQQIETLQAERNQYRLAFFGLLAIALFALVLLIAYKIVRKKRAQM